MSRNDPKQSLAEKLAITSADLRERKQLLGLTPEHEQLLGRQRPTVELVIDQVIADFYRRQLEVPAIRALIGDRDTLDHLKRTMHDYVLDLFGGDYGADYAARRLRVGRVHGRIGIPPKYYIAALMQLLRLLTETIEEHSPEFPSTALKRLLLFDLELTFDTYVHGLLGQLEATNEELVSYTHSLEDIVRERTEHIERLSRLDQLTGLQNRNHFSATFEKERLLARTRRQPFCVFFADLDRFKAVNDTEGHSVGDDVLRKTGSILQRLCERSDIVFRYGGDEFCLLLAGFEEAAAQDIYDRLQVELTCATEGKITISAGWVIAAPEDKRGCQDLLRLADQAMYAEKDRHLGDKNRPLRAAG